jgi:hypothetical protein
VGVGLGLAARYILGPLPPSEQGQRRFQQPDPEVPTWAMLPSSELLQNSIPPNWKIDSPQSPSNGTESQSNDDWYLDLPLSRPGKNVKPKNDGN